MPQLDGLICEATVWFTMPEWGIPDKRRCGKPAKATRGPGEIPVCGIHLRSKSVYRYQPLRAW